MLFRSPPSLPPPPPPPLQVPSAAGGPSDPAAARVAMGAAGAAQRFLAPDFLDAWRREIVLDPFFGPIFAGAQHTLGVPVDKRGQPVSPQANRPAGGAFVVHCGLLYRRGQGEDDRLCVPDGGGLRRRVLQECHDSPLGGHFGGAKTAALVRRLAFWPGLYRDVTDYVRSCDTCQRTKAEHVGPRGLLHPLTPPSRRGGTIGID